MSNEELPTVIEQGRGMSMIFLRNEAYITRVHITGEPGGDVMNIPSHWHETHDEILSIVEGQIEISLDSKVKLYGPEDGEILIAKGVVHTLKTYPGVKVTMEERTDPMDGEKEMFFRNLLAGPLTNIFAVSQICYHGDTRPALPVRIPWLEKVIITILGGYIAPMLGYRLKHTMRKS